MKPSYNALNKALTAALKLAAVAAIVVAIATMPRIGNAASRSRPTRQPHTPHRRPVHPGRQVLPLPDFRLPECHIPVKLAE